MVFSAGLKLLRFTCFWKCQIGKDQRSQLNKDTLSKKFSAIEVLDMCLPDVKKHFQLYQGEMFFFFRDKITEICLFLGMLISE